MPSFVPNRTESMPKNAFRTLSGRGWSSKLRHDFYLDLHRFRQQTGSFGSFCLLTFVQWRGWSPGCFLQVSMSMPNTRGRPNLPKSICASYAHFSSCAGMVASTLCREFISDESQNRDLRVPSWRSCMSFFAVSRSCACDRSLSQPC